MAKTTNLADWDTEELCDLFDLFESVERNIIPSVVATEIDRAIDAAPCASPLESDDFANTQLAKEGS